MTPGTRGGLAVIAALTAACLIGVLANAAAGTLVGLGVGVVIILAVPAKAKPPAG